MIKATLLFNSFAGRARAQGITPEDLLGRLLEHGIEAVVLRVEETGGIAEKVLSVDNAELCIIAGGDGTIYEAIQSNRCLEFRVAIIPLGSANNLANAAGIPMDIEDAIDVAATGTERRIDLGRAGGRTFTQAAGAGFHAEAFRLYGKHREKSFLDASRALLEAFMTWTPQIINVKVDGVLYSEEAIQVTAANTPFYGRNIRIAPYAKIDDGLLDVLIIKNCKKKIELVQCIAKVMEGRAAEMSNVTRVPARIVEISNPDGSKIPVHADAEPIGFAPVTIEVLPACLRLMVPS